MSRPLRIAYPGAWYHVMNRGRRRERIFLSRADYETFLEVVQETEESWNLKVAAYCLMPNHYHLLLQTPDGNISRCMRHINGVYTQRFNRHHKLDGQLFRGRYKAVLIDSDRHLLEVMRYIHRNPLRAGMARDLSDYPWVSHQGYLSHAKKWIRLDKDFLLDMLSDRKSRQRAAYIDFISQDEPEEIEKFYTLKNLPSVLGGDSFQEWVKERFRPLSFQEDIPESRLLAPAAADVVSAVCDYFRVKEEDIFGSKRGTVNLPRDVAIYLIRRHCRETLAVVGRHFAISKYSTVSSAVERIKARKDNDKLLQKHLKRIGENLAKGQQQT